MSGAARARPGPAGRLRRAARRRRAGRLRQPRARPAAPRATGSTAATPRSPPSWPAGRCACGAPTTPSSAPSCDRPLGPSRCATCSGWAPTSCSRCGCPPTPRSPPPSTLVRQRWGTGPAGFVNAVLRRVSERSAGRLDGPARRRPRGTACLAPALGGRGARHRPRRPRGRAATRCWPPTTSHPGSPWWPAPDWPPSTSSAGAPPAGQSRTPSRHEGGDPGALAAVREGRAGVQDAGSQLVAMALAEAALDGPDGRWLDVCAGPGGKAALLAALAAQRGARVARRRAAAAPGRAGALGCPGSLQPAWPVWWPPTAPGPPGAERAFDRVLVDAPCTGLGALRRRPESALAPSARGRRAAGPAPARAARRRPGLGPPRWRRRLRDLLAGRRGDGRRRARRCWPRGATYDFSRRRPCCPRLATPRAPPARGAPAVAAPARHRRDVPGAAAPDR